MDAATSPVSEPDDVRPSSVRANTAWSLIGTAVHSLSLWTLLAFIARSDTVAAGEYGLAMTVVTPIFLFTNLNLRVVMAVDGDGSGLYDHLTVRFAAVLIAVPSIAIFALVLGVGWSFVPLLVVFAAARWVESFSGTMYGVYLSRRSLKSTAIGMGARGLLALALGALAWTQFESVLAVGLGIVIAWTVVLVAVEFPLARRMTGALRSPSRTAQLALLRRGLPLGADSAANSFSHNIPRLAIEQTLGLGALGLYLPLAQLVQYGTVMVGSLGNALLAQFSAQLRNDRRDQFQRLFTRVAVIMVAAAASFVGVTVLLGPAIVRILLGERFVDGPLILALAVAVAIISVERILARGLQAAGEFGRILRIDLVIVAVVLVSAFVLVPVVGSAGAAWGIAIGFAVGLMLVIHSLRKVGLVQTEAGGLVE